MAENMPLTHIPLTVIVAATAKSGIGKNGGLPWPMLKKDMAYFARVTTRVPAATQADPSDSSAAGEESARRNVVIMGRKTWDSIPVKFRPLRNRTNVVISTQDRTQLQPPLLDDVVVASDIRTGLQSLEDLIRAGRAPPVGRAFVIGGSSIYQAALDLPQTKQILMTRIMKDYDCDTSFPEALDGTGEQSSEWERASHVLLQKFTGEAVDEGPLLDKAGDEEVGLDFRLYCRRTT